MLLSNFKPQREALFVFVMIYCCCLCFCLTLILTSERGTLCFCHDLLLLPNFKPQREALFAELELAEAKAAVTPLSSTLPARTHRSAPSRRGLQTEFVYYISNSACSFGSLLIALIQEVVVFLQEEISRCNLFLSSNLNLSRSQVCRRQRERRKSCCLEGTAAD